ncbi:MAG TPA: glycosyltransferase family 39 protein [Pyrinomonadaceae bacterium]|nr:glycosyltransferase family 39 protein [Pyrinomonadaceae bacterium]
MHPSTLAKRLYLFLFIIIIAFYLYGLSKLPLLGPDEPRYAQVAREMFLTGDLITPRLGGHTWFEKPALLYWMMVAAFKTFGISEWSARLGPALCGLLTIAAVWCVGREIRVGESSALVMATCLGLIVFSRAASFDVVITMTTSWSLAFFLLHELSTTRRKRLLLVGFYSFVGLSLLAKGLVGLVIPFGVVGLFYLLRRRWPQRRVMLSLLWGLPLALAVSAIWYGPVIARNGWTFVDEFFVQHHFARYVSNKYHHPQPIYFFPVIILLLALPWTAHLTAAVWRGRWWAWRGGDDLDILRVFSLAWLLAPVVFFSFSGSKLPGYVLPSLPGAALLISDVLRRRKPAEYISIAGATLVLVLIALTSFAGRFAREESVRDLLLLANARGYADAPVLAQRGDDRSAEFYAYDRVVYDEHGEVVTFDEISLDQARARGRRFLVLIPVQYVENFRGVPGIEVIGDNGRTAILGWNVPGEKKLPEVAVEEIDHDTIVGFALLAGR